MSEAWKVLVKAISRTIGTETLDRLVYLVPPAVAAHHGP